MRSARSSIIDTRESIDSTFYVGQKLEQISPSSAKKFLETCPNRTDNDDRTDLSIIKRQDMMNSLQRLSSREDVHGVMVATIDGQILYPNDVLNSWISSLTPLCQLARDVVRNLDSNDLIRAVRLRTRKYEIIITINETQLLIVMQIVADPRPMNIDSEEDLHNFLKRIQTKQ